MTNWDSLSKKYRINCSVEWIKKRDPRAIPELINLMCSTTAAYGSSYPYDTGWSEIVRAASEALVRIGKPAAVPLAAELAEFKLELYPYGSGFSIAAVIKTLGKIPEPAVLPVLLDVCSRASHDQSWGPEVCRICREAITAIAPNIEHNVEADKKRSQASWLEKLKRKFR